jgi:hypothetical protein
VKQFCDWIEERSVDTRRAIGEVPLDEASTEAD